MIYPNNLISCFRFIICVVALTSVSSEIIRLECRKHANFSIIKPNFYYTGTISLTLFNLTKEDCALSCVAHTVCSRFNHKMDNTKCELMTSAVGTEGQSPAWQIVSTKVYGRNVSKISYQFEIIIQKCVLFKNAFLFYLFFEQFNLNSKVKIAQYCSLKYTY